MKSNRSKEWTESEARGLSILARRKVSAEDIAKALGRHVASIRHKARSLGLLLFKRPPRNDNTAKRAYGVMASGWLILSGTYVKS